MGRWFSADYLEGEFVMFGPSHFAVLAVLVILNVAMVVVLRRVKNERVHAGFRYGWAALLILQEISLNYWRIYNGTWTVGEALPLHLCGAAIILSAIMLVTKSYALYEIGYFWGFAGAIQPLLTPDSTYAFPHYRYFQVFLSHGAIVTAVVYMTFVVRYRPTWASLWKAFLVTNLYLAVIALFNWATGANYLFICHKPETASLMDMMAPWPWYVLTLQFVGLGFYILFYLPYAIGDLIRARRDRSALPAT